MFLKFMYFEGIVLFIIKLLGKTSLELTISDHILEKNYINFQHVKNKLQSSVEHEIEHKFNY